jgi:hypothetical protein
LKNSHSVHFLETAGRVETRILDLCALGASATLPYDPKRYFLPAEESFPIPIDRLVTSRCRPDGVANAAKFMLASFRNQYPPREPITVSPLDDRYLVEDGNSTVLNAVASGWPDIPCRLAGMPTVGPDHSSR